MVTINIVEFTDYDTKAIHEFLLLQQETEFKIFVPRVPWADSDNNDLSVEFLHASFAGHLLGQLSTNFAYYVPCPGKNEAFFFEVSITDLEKLSTTLHFIVQGYNYPAVSLDNNAFHEQAVDFLAEFSCWDSDCHTRGIYQIAVKLMEM